MLIELHVTDDCVWRTKEGIDARLAEIGKNNRFLRRYSLLDLCIEPVHVNLSIEDAAIRERELALAAMKSGISLSELKSQLSKGKTVTYEV
jgi:hypothetical protein